MKSNKILVVDDDEDILEFIEYALSKENFDVKTAKNGFEALNIIVDFLPSLVLIDWMMPELNGIDTLKKIRENKEYDKIKVVFLSARNEESFQIMSLDSGADDYFFKPIKPKLLVAKLKAHLRNIDENTDNNIVLKNFVIDKNKFLVIKDSIELKLPKKEFNLLCLLTSKPNNVFYREEILDKVWGKEVYIGDRTIDVHIRKLREKLGDELFITIKGVGYKYQEQ